MVLTEEEIAKVKKQGFFVQKSSGPGWIIGWFAWALFGMLVLFFIRKGIVEHWNQIEAGDLLLLGAILVIAFVMAPPDLRKTKVKNELKCIEGINKTANRKYIRQVAEELDWKVVRNNRKYTVIEVTGENSSKKKSVFQRHLYIIHHRNWLFFAGAVSKRHDWEYFTFDKETRQAEKLFQRQFKNAISLLPARHQTMPPAFDLSALKPPSN